MNNEIYSTKHEGCLAWMTVTKGRKYITLEYKTVVQGDHDVTVTYPLDAEQQLLYCIRDRFMTYGIEQLTEPLEEAPTPLKIYIHKN